jgi:hypothetical protein
MHFLLLLLLSLLPYPQQVRIPGPGGAGAASGTNPTFITDVTNTSFCLNQTTCAATAFTPQTGDLILVFAYAGGSSGTISAPTDTCGTSGGASNSYTSQATNSSSWHSALYSTIVGFGKSCVVTGNYGAVSGVNLQTYVQNWRGVNGTTLGGIHTNVGNCNVAGESESFSSIISGASATFTTTGGTNNFYHTFAAVIQHP